MVFCYVCAILIRFWAGLGFVMWTNRFDFGGDLGKTNKSKTLKIIDSINVLGSFRGGFQYWRNHKIQIMVFLDFSVCA